MRQKLGEIDIIARKDGVVHFIEVKSVSREIWASGIISGSQGIRPEENLNEYKLKRLSRVIQAYIVSERIDKWQFDLCVVYIDTTHKKAKVKLMNNLLLPE